MQLCPSNVAHEIISELLSSSMIYGGIVYLELSTLSTEVIYALHPTPTSSIFSKIAVTIIRFSFDGSIFCKKASRDVATCHNISFGILNVILNGIPGPYLLNASNYYLKFKKTTKMQFGYR
jgi:hypothetical protein